MYAVAVPERVMFEEYVVVSVALPFRRGTPSHKVVISAGLAVTPMLVV